MSSPSFSVNQVSVNLYSADKCQLNPQNKVLISLITSQLRLVFGLLCYLLCEIQPSVRAEFTSCYLVKFCCTALNTTITNTSWQLA